MLPLLLGCSTCTGATEAVPTPTTGRFALGINEAISIPMAVRGDGPPDEAAQDKLDKDAELAAAVGARLIRGHTGNYPRANWMYWTEHPEIAQPETDAWLLAAQSRGLEPILMLSPWPGNQTSAYSARYVPEDLAGYTTWVKQVVERYDGDGVDDMPGLKGGVSLFEVDNEPDLKNTNEPRGGNGKIDPAKFCLPEDYAAVVIATSSAVKAASPTAKVLAGGFYRPHAKGTWAYMDTLFAVDGVKAAIDILSVHTYSDDAEAERLAAGIGALRQRVGDKPVWVTETSVTNAAGEQEQARLLAAAVGRAAIAGAERLFWHTLADPPERAGGRRGPSAFATNSLYRTIGSGRRDLKPVGVTYQALAKVLVEHDLVGAVADGDGAAKFPDGSVLLWSGTRPAPKGGVDLRTGAALTGDAVAPAWIAP